MKRRESEEFSALIGLDWADQKHDVCLQVAGQSEVEHQVLEHSPEAIDAWARQLRQRFGGRPVGVCLELSRGPIVSALQKYDFFVLFPINPQSRHVGSIRGTQMSAQRPILCSGGRRRLRSIPPHRIGQPPR